MATAEQALEWVNKLYRKLSERRPSIEKAFKHFEGDQPLVYATEKWQQFHQERYKDFSDNWCGVVGRAPADRLHIDGFRLGDSTDQLTDDERELLDDWHRNELEAQSKQGFLSSIIAKRSFVLVWGDADDNPEVTWEHPSQVIVAYDPSSRHRRAALKAWMDRDENREYATLYLPDEVWKFERAVSGPAIQNSGFILPASVIASAGGWTPRNVASDKSWPLENPLGEVPVVEWQNRPLLGGEPISDIDGTMAMQDAINMLWAYMFASADFASMPARVVLGGDVPKVPVLDDNGQVVGEKPALMEDLARGRLLFLPGAEKIDQWDAAKLDVFTSVITQAVGHIAAQTSTPGHYLLSNEKFANLNGDALTAAEVPLATKVKDQQVYFSPAAKETARLMALVRGKAGMAERIRATAGSRFVQWKDPAMHSLAQVADAALKARSVGFSLRTVLETRYGMTEPEIEREMQRLQTEALDPVTAELLAKVRAGAGNGA